MTERTVQLSVYPNDEGYVVRWKRNGKRLVVKLRGATESTVRQEAAKLLMEALTLLRVEAG